MQPKAGFDHESALYLIAEMDVLGIKNDDLRPAVRHRTWVEKLHGYEKFADRESRNPRENTRDRASLLPMERRMGEWARYQRQRRSNLCRFQVLRLDASPAFRWHPHEDAWNAQCDAFIRHVQRHGQPPFLNAADQNEFTLARWLHRQLQKLKDGTLSDQRNRRLNDALDLVQQTFRSRSDLGQKVAKKSRDSS